MAVTPSLRILPLGEVGGVRFEGRKRDRQSRHEKRLAEFLARCTIGRDALLPPHDATDDELRMLWHFLRSGGQ